MGRPKKVGRPKGSKNKRNKISKTNKRALKYHSKKTGVPYRKLKKVQKKTQEINRQNRRG